MYFTNVNITNDFHQDENTRNNKDHVKQGVKIKKIGMHKFIYCIEIDVISNEANSLLIPRSMSCLTAAFTDKFYLTSHFFSLTKMLI